MKKLLIAVAALIFTPLSVAPASAHMVWLERPTPETARAYFGEMISRHEKTGALLDKIQPVIFLDPVHPLAQTRGEDFIEVNASGDVRLADERYPPFSEGERGTMRPMMYARWGRIDTKALMAFEFVPDAPGGDGFTLMLAGKPAARAKVVLIDADGFDTKYETDDAGHVTVTPEGPGQFILRASAIDRTPGEFAGKPYDFTARVTTLTFINP